jgi:hypothetical protein
VASILKMSIKAETTTLTKRNWERKGKALQVVLKYLMVIQHIEIKENNFLRQK